MFVTQPGGQCGQSSIIEGQVPVPEHAVSWAIVRGLLLLRMSEMGRHLRGSEHRRDPVYLGSWYGPSSCRVENELFGVKGKAGMDGPGGRWCGLSSGWWPGSRHTVKVDPFRFADGWGVSCERKSRATLGTLA